jgi:hypothetical protein
MAEETQPHLVTTADELEAVHQLIKKGRPLICRTRDRRGMRCLVQNAANLDRPDNAYKAHTSLAEEDGYSNIRVELQLGAPRKFDEAAWRRRHDDIRIMINEAFENAG